MGTTTGAWYVTRTVTAEPGPCDQDDGDRGRGQDDQGVLGGRLTLLSTERQPSCGPVPDQGAHLRSQPRPRSNVQLEHVVHLLSFRSVAGQRSDLIVASTT